MNVSASTGKTASVAAAVSSLATVVCCMPFGTAAVLAAAGPSLVLATLQPWLLGLSFALLAIAGVQLRRGATACRRRSVANIAVFGAAAGIVLAITLFPQWVAGWLSNVLP